MSLWKEIDDLLEEYHRVHIDDTYNYDLFNRIAISYHSTSLEGSSLTAIEAQVLIESGIPAKGKPLEHSNMVKDHYDALVFACGEALKKRAISPIFIQEINAHVMKSTGGIVNQIGGSYDSSRGELRKGAVSAGSTLFPDYKKVPDLLKQCCAQITELDKKAKSVREILTLSFTAHFNLVSIHPFADGNGRTSRILMNYLQTGHNLPMGMVYMDHRVEYIEALNESRKAGRIDPITSFMAMEYRRFLKEQIDRTKKQDGGISLLF